MADRRSSVLAWLVARLGCIRSAPGAGLAMNIGLRLRSVLDRDGRGHAGGQHDWAWYVVQLHPNRNPLRKAHPRENRVHRRKALHARRSVRNVDAVAKPGDMSPCRPVWICHQNQPRAVAEPDSRHLGFLEIPDHPEAVRIYECHRRLAGRSEASLLVGYFEE